MKLKAVSFNNAVFFDGSTAKQVNLKTTGCIELSDDGLTVILSPRDPKRDRKHVPITNVSDYVELDEDAEAARVLDEEARIRAAATVTKTDAAKPKLKGIVKFQKNPETGVVEEILT